ncbi:MAG: DUF2505 family protein [Polyangiaceae bacterium]
MRFEISHDFDAPLDTIELAVLSPDLGARLASELAQTKIESVNTLTHELRDGRLHRVLEFQASAPFAFLKNVAVPKDAMSWQERTTYSIAEHGATWSVHPKEQYSRYFNSHGTYRLTTLPDGRTRRTVVGELFVNVPLLRAVIERAALVEVRRTYDAEASTLKHFTTL